MERLSAVLCVATSVLAKKFKWASINPEKYTCAIDNNDTLELHYVRRMFHAKRWEFKAAIDE